MITRVGHKFVLVVVLLLLVSLACITSTPTPEAPPITVPYPTTLVPPSIIVSTPEPPLQSIDTPGSVEETSPDSKFSWLTISIPSAIASGASSIVAPEIKPSDQTPPWDVAPLHEEIYLENYVLADTFHKASIFIFPVADYIVLQPDLSSRVDILKQILQDTPEEPGTVPLLPIWNAGQMFLSKPDYLKFENGSGIRYLTMYGQGFAPINNHDLFYSFQGLTADGGYWVSVIMPVNHPSLQATYDDPLPANFTQFAENFEQYTKLIRANLDTQPGDTFSPSIVDLDAMIQSMLIKPLGP